MAQFDLPLEELQRYKPERTEPPDFDAFWQETLEDARAKVRPTRFERVDVGLRTVETFDVTFTGFAGQEVRAWLQLPRDRDRGSRLPLVVEYIGYGGGRGFPFHWLFWPSAGYAHFVMDTRGQGSSWQPGDTPDPEPDGSNPHYPGFLTRGAIRMGFGIMGGATTTGVYSRTVCGRSRRRASTSRSTRTGRSRAEGARAARSRSPSRRWRPPSVPR